ncbi:hypothetical protein HHK36_003274 [Tetracentron sinense]|uniref:NAC domain-containing protein n=1 Tax=Tetracentron sinense TaxID=13715 RepID=A0A834ZXZ2_TETSI|nr:hypothetical protein HHK36_003274 [Tetracentron sinense]
MNLLLSSSSSSAQQHHFFPPPGYRFRPTDSELLVHYLKKKLEGIPFPTKIIHDFNVYSCNPHDLSRIFISAEEDKFYFFSPRERRSAKESRPIRAAGDGFWKASSGYVKVKDEHGRVVRNGKKRSLVFYLGKPSKKPEKTKWLMQEFLLDSDPPTTSNGLRKSMWVSVCYPSQPYSNPVLTQEITNHAGWQTDQSAEAACWCCNDCFNKANISSVSTQGIHNGVGLQNKPIAGAFLGGNEYLNQENTCFVLTQEMNNHVGFQTHEPVEGSVPQINGGEYINQENTGSVLTPGFYVNDEFQTHESYQQLLFKAEQFLNLDHDEDECSLNAD